MRNLLKDSLKKLVDRDDKRPRGSRNARVVAVAAQKGGVGKTTTVVNLAARLAEEHGMRTLVIDLDAQGHVEKSLRGHVSRRAGSLSTVLEDESGGREIMDVASATNIDNLYITTADSRLRETENLLNTRMGKERVLSETIETTRTHYDVILIDCPPNIGNLTINGLTAADYVVVPCDATPLAIEGVSSLIRVCRMLIEKRINPDIDVLGILITRFDGRNVKLNERAVGELEETYGEMLFDTRIGINTSLSQAQDEGASIFAHAPQSRGAQHYGELADEIVQRLKARRSA